MIYKYLTKFSLLIFLMNISVTYAGGKSNTEKAGDILQILIPATAYVTTLALNDLEGRNQFYKSLATNLGLTYTLKYTVNKPRPENNGDNSFPSGHTSAAFQGATSIHLRYGLKYGIPAYIGATFVGWSRVEGESDKHDLSDVAAGATIGILSSLYFTTLYKNLTITPVLNKSTTGITLNYRW